MLFRSYEGDWHALFTSAGIAAGDFNGLLLAYINLKLGSSYDNLPGAMNAFAVAKSTTAALSWNELGAFVIATGTNPLWWGASNDLQWGTGNALTWG